VTPQDVLKTVSIDPTSLVDFVPYIIAGVWVLVVFWVLIIWYVRKVRAKARLMHRTVTFLVRLPKETGKEGEKATSIEQLREDISVTETFFSAIGGLHPEGGLGAFLSGYKEVFAFEFVAHGGLISFYITVPEEKTEFIEQQIHAQFPDAAINIAPDYNMFTPKSTIIGTAMTFRRESAFPIKTYRKLEGDPLSGLTHPLTKMREHEGVAIQFLVKSAKPNWRNYGLQIVRKLQKGKTLHQIENERSIFHILGTFWDAGMKSEEQKEKDKQELKENKLSPMEEEMVKGLDEKASKAGLDVNVRVVVSSEDKDRVAELLTNIVSSFSQFSIYEFGNAFQKSIPSNKKKFLHDFIYRTFDDGKKITLNTEELASVWHLPLPSTETPNINWLIARGSAPPANIPTSGLRLGEVEYRGVHTDIYMKEDDRRRHLYMIGKSGSGKTNTIEALAIQDIRAGRGVGIIDPNGDLIEWILGNIPPERIDDVILFKPSDLERPMGLNMLEAKTEEQKDFAAAEMVQIFYKLYGPEMIGPMFEHDMRNVMLTLMSDVNDVGTLTEIPRMFSDAEYQKVWRAKIKDPVVKSYWDNEVDKTSDFHKSEKLGYLISKVGRFVENEMMRNIIGQKKSSFDFRDVMDKSKILLVNLSKGTTGEINAKLLGMIMVTKLQMAAFSRAELQESERKDFYLYIDEFQNFVTDSIATILSEARKYRLCLIVAHQYLNQLAEGGKREVLDAVLGNVGTTLVSRIGPEDVETLVKLYEPTFGPFDLMNSPKQTWYTKMIIDDNSTRPFAMHGYWAGKTDPELAKKIYELSRLKYGRPRDLVAAEILERSQLGQKKDVDALPDPFAELLK